MKIIHVINSGEIGGTQTCVLALSIGMKRLGHDVELVCRGKGGAIVEKFEQNGIPVTSLGARSGHDLKATVRLRRSLRKSAPDLVHFHGLPILAPIALIGLRATRIWTPHVRVEARCNRLLSAFYRIWPFLNGWITVSDSVQKTFCEGGLWRGLSHKTVYNGIDLSRFCPDKDLSDPSDTTPLRLVSVSRMEQDKSPQDTIEAVRLLRERNDRPVELTLIGDGSLLPECRELVRKYDLGKTVSIVGMQPDPERYMRSAHLILVLSQYETFGLSPLEGLACGCPVIAYPVEGGMQEWLPGGPAAIYTDGRTPEKLAEAILPILNSPVLWRPMRETALEIAQDFSIENFANNTVEYYLKRIAAR
jgi:glycosyltransferase involved in cell wall biosynthesis